MKKRVRCVCCRSAVSRNDAIPTEDGQFLCLSCEREGWEEMQRRHDEEEWAEVNRLVSSGVSARRIA